MDNLHTSMRAWAEVDLDAVLKNHRAMRALTPENVKIASVIKADAYGHGSKRIARLLENETDYFAVAMTDEAVQLRLDGIRRPILVLAHTPAGDFSRLTAYNIETSVSSLDEAVELSDFAKTKGKKIGIHIALDTGMCRIGFACTDRAAEEIAKVASLEGVKICGIFSHFAMADAEDLEFTAYQAKLYSDMVEKLEALGVEIPLKHICNSAGAVTDTAKFDMIREGILLYGIPPSAECDLSSFGEVSPALSLRTHVSSVRRVPAGTPVSYGCTYVTERESVIATLQIGYADGVPRALSNKGDVLIRGKRAKIAGRVCMDQMMVDVTDIEGVKRGDVATVIGADGDDIILATEVADIVGTIAYEIVCGISKRVPRVYTEGGEVTGVATMLRG